jgi:chromosome partitioning protein
MKTIVFASKKGGVSKTTSALFTAQYLAKKYKTLLIDLDSQNALTDFFFDEYQDVTVLEGIRGDVPFKSCIQQVSENLSVIPNKLSFEEVNHWNITAKEFRLKDELSLFEDDFDFVVIDTPPALNTETVLGLVCADIVIIPARLEKMDTRAIDFTLEKIKTQILPHFNKTLSKVFILGTQYIYQNRTVNDVAYKSLTDEYGEMVLPFTIPYSSKISQSNYIGFTDKNTDIPEYEQLVEVVVNG